MKKLALLLTVVLLSACNYTTTVEKKNSIETMNGKPITVVVFDDCEYVGFFDGSGYSYTHKGNCKYCLTRLDQIVSLHSYNR